MKKANLFIITIFYTMILINCKNINNECYQKFVLQYTNDITLRELSNCQLERVSKLENGIINITEQTTIGGIKIKRSFLFKRVGNKVYEMKILTDFDGTPIDTIFVLNYCTIIKDTSFLYSYDIQKYPPTKPFRSDDYYYSLKELSDNLFVQYKESYADSTFSEMQFYDKEFNLKKIVKVVKGKYYEYLNKSLVKNKNFNSCFYNEYLKKVKTFTKLN